MRAVCPTRRIGVIVSLLGLLLHSRHAFSQPLPFEPLKTFVYPSVDPGGNPAGRMVQAADGLIYGLTSGLHTNGCASAYRFDPQAPATTFETLWTGSASNCKVGSAEGIDGAIGDGGLVKAGDGDLYFALSEGGASGAGAIYRITAGSGLVEPFFDFAASPTHALTLYGPQSGLAVGPDGALYGATLYGRSSGDTGDGGVGGWFRLTTDGTFTALADMPAVSCGTAPTEFCKSALGYYLNPLTVGSDGNIYGVLVNANMHQPSFLYRVYPATGEMETLHAFAHDGGSRGQRPVGALVEIPPIQGQAIAFAGVTRDGGAMFPQTIYFVAVTASAIVTPVYSGTIFGDNPRAGLVRDPGDGALYGTTYGAIGTTGGISTVFRIGADRVLTVVYRRVADLSFQPFAPVLIGADQHLYSSSFGFEVPGGFLFRLLKAEQAPLSVVAPVSAAYATSFTATSTGGSGNGTVTFTVSGACLNIDGGALITIITGTGTCFVTATKAGDAQYGSKTSAAASVLAVKADQEPLTIFGAPDTAAYGSVFLVDASGGAGIGALSFSATGACGNQSDLITMTSSTGTCSIVVTKDADNNYNGTSASVDVTATKADQPTLTIVGAPLLAANNTVLDLSTTGGGGTGTTIFSVTGVCSNVSGGPSITITSASGTCTIVATRAGDTNYLPATSAAVVVNAIDVLPVFERLRTFVYPSVDPSGNPAGRMVQAADSLVYGLTSGLHTNGCASAYRFDPQAPATTFETLWTGSGSNCKVGSAEGIDGAIGDGGLVKAGDGNLYFALPEGGDSHGAIFRITAGSGVVEPFYDFASPAHALTLYGPQSGLAVGPDGALYGAALHGRSSGDTGDGGVGGWFRLTTDGTFTALVDMPAVLCGPAPTEFCKSAGGYYLNPLTVGSDGNIYGVLVNAETHPSFLYKVFLEIGDVVMVPLHTFAHDGGRKGLLPVGALVEVPPILGQVIAFVGVTRGGGGLFPQSIYYVDVMGGTANVTPLFTGTAFGDAPRAGLVRDPVNGALYGTTYGGGLATVFRITAGFRIGFDPVLTVLYQRFQDVNFQPFAPVLVGADGHLYGSSFGLSAEDPGGFLFRLRLHGKAAQALLSITGAPDAAVYQETFTVDTAGGSGTGAVTFAASGACINSGGGALITMISGTGTCAIVATKAGDDDYEDALASDSVDAAQAPQQALAIAGAPGTAAVGTSFTVGTTGGTGTGTLTFSATGACSNIDGGPVITMTASTGTCAIGAIKAADDNYLSATSPIIPVTATGAGAPAAPTSAAAVANSGTQITVTWIDNAGDEEGFVIERSTTNSNNFARMATLAANVTTFVDSAGLTPTTKYLYRVLAFNSGGSSPYSNTASATTLNPPAAPTGLTATAVSRSEINLTWISKGNHATGFKVSRSLDGTTFSVVATLGLVTTYSDAALAPATYYYQVQALNANGDSEPSNTASASTVPTPPLAPTSLKAMSLSNSSINLTWTNPASIVEFITIERSVDGTTFTGIGSVPGSATSYVDSGLAGGTTYVYRVRASNTAGVSPYSNTASSRTKVR